MFGVESSFDIIHMITLFSSSRRLWREKCMASTVCGTHVGNLSTIQGQGSNVVCSLNWTESQVNEHENALMSINS